MNASAESGHDTLRRSAKFNGFATPVVVDARRSHGSSTIEPNGPRALMRPRLLLEERGHTEDFAAANRRMNERLAVVSHELRNSVGSIRLAARLMEMRHHDLAAVENARLVIERQAGQMARLIDDLLQVARIGGGGLRLRRERVDLRVAAKQAVATIELEVGQRDQRLTVALPEAPVWLQADPGRLSQILGNLLGNAAKYTDNGGELRLSVDREAGRATVRVRDSGIGIAPDVLPHVFDPFMQAESSGQRSEGGIGIGLTLVRSLVELHGGFVTAASAGLGRGSEFTVHLPATVD